MKQSSRIEIREWLNTSIAFLALLLAVFGFIYGIGELQEIRVSLDQLITRNVTAESINIIDQNGTTIGILNSDGLIFNGGSGIHLNG